MGFLDRLRQAFTGGAPKVRRDFWVYVQCNRCGEPLRGRIDMMNDPSLADDGETYIVRKRIMGGGENRCFQQVEIILRFDAQRQPMSEREISGGRFITEDEYEELKEQQNAQADHSGELEDEQDAGPGD